MPAATAAAPAKKVVPVLDQPMNKQGEVMRASTSEYKGKTYLSIRVYYTDAQTGQLLPGKNGINVPLEEGLKLFKAAKHLESGLR